MGSIPITRSILAMSSFADKLIAWQRAHGRHDLPWQGTRDAYRIWVSEIMLQQTQVSTVVPYYQRFMARFPDVAALAAADEDEVLAHWSGLGYYSRARNLHAAAKRICALHGGEFPRDLDAAVDLPGIGRSTASAILAFAHGARLAILDGNVKRVLARCFGIRGYPGESAVEAALWRQAEALLPSRDVEAYTQGIMDLGATICARRAPSCSACPVSADCEALRRDAVAELPTPRPRRALPHRHTTMLVLERDAQIMLEKRPAPGIWGGLWCLPEIAPDEDPVAASARFGLIAEPAEAMRAVKHAFTHFHLTITPARLKVAATHALAAEPGRRWWTLEEARGAGLPAPVRRILERLAP